MAHTADKGVHRLALRVCVYCRAAVLTGKSQSFNSQKSELELEAPCYNWGNWDPERVGDLAKIWRH